MPSIGNPLPRFRTLVSHVLVVALLAGCGGTAGPGTSSSFSGDVAQTDSVTSPDASRNVAATRDDVEVTRTRALTASAVPSQNLLPEEANPALMPVGSNRLRVLTPNVVELTRITTAPKEGQPTAWNFAAAIPAASKFVVKAGATTMTVSAVGFKQRPYYAPDRTYDLRLNASLYLQLSTAIPVNAQVTVTNPDATIFPSTMVFTATASDSRYSPVVHTNQEGYVASMAKKAMVGYYLGSLGELAIPYANGFKLVDRNGATAYTGTLVKRAEVGGAAATVYQNVYEADFTAFRTPGTYRLVVPGVGSSYSFRVGDEVAANYVRAFALGMYHQRCGDALVQPFTRFVHAVCHGALVDIATNSFTTVNSYLAKWSGSPDAYQTAPILNSVAAGLYQWVRTGKIDAHGGHHDAGDYSKYTINVAQLIHHLGFAADALPGVGALDNLGLPESGDGKSDILQMAKWEADFLLRIQDTDGGFAFLVYPRDNAYEWNATPDQGWPQVVYPKNTSATAAAVAALAEMGSSPLMKQQFPTEAAAYAAAAKKGWTFLQNAWARHGRQGAYQKMTHYGLVFSDKDEIAWAQSAMYVLTGDPAIHTMLKAEFDPAASVNIRWGWQRLFEGYGGAIRTYAFAARTGRLPLAALDATLLARCEEQIRLNGQEHLSWTNSSSYNVTYAAPDKRGNNAAWYSPSSQSFEMAVANVIAPNPAYLDAILGNVNYELGTNPVNRSFVTGQGWTAQYEIVSQFAKNDRRMLPPSGLPIGTPAATQPYLGTYGNTLRNLNFPADTAAAPYQMYDRHTDTWNVYNEVVTFLGARGMIATAYVMAQTPMKTQAWRAAPATISGVPSAVPPNTPVTATLNVAGMDLSTATRVIWEATGQNPVFGGPTATFSIPSTGAAWIEAEVQWPDGRRAFAVLDFTVSTDAPSPSPSPTATTSPSPTPTATATTSPSPTPTATATTSPSPTPTSTSTTSPTPTSTTTTSPTPTSTSTPAPTPSGYPVTVGSYSLTGDVSALNSGVVSFSTYGVTAQVPSGQATFTIGGVTTLYSQLAVGNRIYATITPFTGSLLDVTGIKVTLQSPSGTMVTPGQALPLATQQQIYVYFKKTDGTTIVTTFDQALSMQKAGQGSIQGEAPSPTATAPAPSPTPTATATTSPSPTATATTSPSPTPTATTSPSPTPTATPNTKYSVSVASYSLTGNVTALSGNVVSMTTYGITARIPVSLATFTVGGKAKNYNQLRVGQEVYATIKPYTGTMSKVLGPTQVDLQATAGLVTSPGQPMPLATQQQIWVYVKTTAGSTLNTSYDKAIAMVKAGAGSITGEAPKPY